MALESTLYGHLIVPISAICAPPLVINGDYHSIFLLMHAYHQRPTSINGPLYSHIASAVLREHFADGAVPASSRNEQKRISCFSSFIRPEIMMSHHLSHAEDISYKYHFMLIILATTYKLILHNSAWHQSDDSFHNAR